MRKLFAAMFLALVACTGANAQLLYKISGKDLKKPSYIVGTFHLVDATYADKIPGVKEALTATDRVCGELDFAYQSNADSMKLMQDAMLLPEGQTLKTVLTAAQFAKVDAFLTKSMGVGLSNAQVMAQMGRMTPAALSIQLQLIMYLQKHVGQFDPTSSLDNYFQLQARNNGEPVVGLETVAFQVSVLLKSASMKRQVEQLMCIIDDPAACERQMEDMAKAFYSHNLESLEKAMNEEKGGPCDSTPEEKALLIDNRNADWARRMPAMMAASPTFFAVGAGHLPGKGGVLQRLRDAGYTVEGVE